MLKGRCKILVTNITGNFGDHVVRYALTRMVAEKNGYTWGINKIPTHDYLGGKEQMDFFHLDYGLPYNTPYGSFSEGITNKWTEKITRFEGYNFYNYQPDVFDVPDNTHLTIFCAQDARYYDREKLRKWFTVGAEEVEEYERTLKNNEIILDENLTVINCRGGEYRGVSDLFLLPIYYKRAIDKMLEENPKMKFVVITDDVGYFKDVFNCRVYHFSIGCDYYIINNAKNLILSNSGFALFPAWLNKNNPNIIAPQHWARHNLGVWASSSIWTFGDDNWIWLDRSGNFTSMVSHSGEKNDNSRT